MSSLTSESLPHSSCPDCGKDFTLRIRRRGALEYLISLFYFYPFGCQLCGRRFIVFKWGMRYIRKTVDRRQYQRINVEIPANFRDSGELIQAVVVDLSLVGCRLKTSFGFSEGSLVELQLAIPGKNLVIDSAIVRVVGPEYAGFEFLRMSTDTKRELGELVLLHLDIVRP
jgi:hypothetical protein